MGDPERSEGLLSFIFVSRSFFSLLFPFLVPDLFSHIKRYVLRKGQGGDEEWGGDVVLSYCSVECYKAHPPVSPDKQEEQRQQFHQQQSQHQQQLLALTQLMNRLQQHAQQNNNDTNDNNN